MPVKRKILFGGLALAALVYASAQAFIIGGWKNYTNTNDVKAFAYADGHVWAATTGGLVKFNPATEARQVFTNAEGLGGNFLLSVAADAKGNLWIGADNGTLTKLELASGRFTVYPFIDRDNRQLKLSAILPDSGRLWIGTDVGVALFLTERNGGEIKEIYRRLGSINSDTPVRSLTFFRDSLWAATPQGVAGAGKKDPNLLDFSHWRSFRRSTNVGLNHEDCYSLLVFQDTLLVGTAKGIYAFLPDSGLPNPGRFRRFRPSIDSAALVSTLVSHADTLYSPWIFGLVQMLPNGGGVDLASDTLYKPGFSRFFPALFVTPQNKLFVATQGKGFAVWERTFYKIYRPTGPPGNFFDDLAVDADGKIWCANDIFGTSMFDGSNWTVFDTVPQMAGQGWAIDIDAASNKWYSFWGGAATVAWGTRPDSFFRFDTLNSPLAGIPGANFFILVTDVAVDYQGNVWWANSLAANGQALVVRKPDGSFKTFGPAEGFISNDIVALYPSGNHIWIAFKQAGTTAGVADLNLDSTVCFPCFPLGTCCRTDTVLTYYNKDNNFLLDNRVTAIAVDREGVLWAGTGGGLSRFNADFQIFETVPLPLSSQVNSIVVDPRNNKWIGTSGGLAVITHEGEIFGPFLPENSGLANPLISDMDFDPKTGYLWIGTTGGLSRLETAVFEEAAELSRVNAFPNPFILSGKGEQVRFAGLPLEAVVHIYTIAGEEVRRLKDTDFWDGKNSKGEYVASGVYLFTVFAPDQKRAVGKLAVIRRF